MFEELRDYIKFVLLMNVSDDECAKIKQGNPSAIIISWNAGTELPSQVEQRVDLIIFGSSASAGAFAPLIARFAQRDALILFEADAGWTPLTDLAETGAVDARVFSLHRLPGALVIGYEPGADFGTRVYAKLLSEFLSPLGRIVTGARVVVDGPFARPELAGNWFLIGQPGISFDLCACSGDMSLVAVDLSASVVTSLPFCTFEDCGALAAVSFPNGLVEIDWECFGGCVSLVEVDLSNTGLTLFCDGCFRGSGLCQLSLPIALSLFDPWALQATPMRTLDLSICAELRVSPWHGRSRLEVRELRLPRCFPARSVPMLLPGSRVEVVQADIEASEAEPFARNLEKWGIDRLRFISPRLERPIEWRAASKPRPESITDPVELMAPSAVFVTSWRGFAWRERNFLRSIDMSTLPVEEFPKGGRLCRCSFLERAIVPIRLRVLPHDFFRSCLRLSLVDTSGCRALEEIGHGAFKGCRSLVVFDFPRTIRRVERQAFAETAIEDVDLSETLVESGWFGHMIFLERMTLPRRCALQGLWGLPVLRRLWFGRASPLGGFAFGRHMREVRFEGFDARSEKARGLDSARVHAEVAAVYECESRPTCPP
jgi:hypothetical protein